MSPRTIFVMPGAPWIDVLDPTPAMIDLRALCERVAKEPRYNGGTPGTVYTVGEHEVRGADAILAETGDAIAAAYFVVHDHHEGNGIRDLATPFKQAVAERAKRDFGVLQKKVLASFEAIVDAHDRAIHAAAGLPWPPHPDIRRLIKRYDARLFFTEWRDLMGNAAHPDFERYCGVAPLDEAIAVPCWSWQVANEQLWDRCQHLLPALKGAR